MRKTDKILLRLFVLLRTPFLVVFISGVNALFDIKVPVLKTGT